VVRLSVTLALLPSLGVVAIGIGWAIATLVELPVYLNPVRRRSGAKLLACTSPSCVAAIGGSAAGWGLAEHYGATVGSALVAGTAGLAIFAVLMLVFARASLKATLSMSRSMLAAARTPSASSAS
jgi:hypothetical protein